MTTTDVILMVTGAAFWLGLHLLLMALVWRSIRKRPW